MQPPFHGDAKGLRALELIPPRFTRQIAEIDIQAFLSSISLGIPCPFPGVNCRAHILDAEKIGVSFLALDAKKRISIFPATLRSLYFELPYRLALPDQFP
jgi:uncharacterized protein YqjF (DUF2071 family)